MEYKTKNPFSGKYLSTYKLADRSKCLESVEIGHKAYKLWRDLSLEERIKYFRKLKDVWDEHRIELAQMCTDEMGKIQKEALLEVDKCASLIDHYCNNAQKYLQSENVVADGLEHRIEFHPVGIVLSIMPWNFPYWQIMRFAVPALLLGNTTIVKPALETSGCGIKIHELFEKAAFPKGVFQNLLTDHESLKSIIADDRIQGVSFTGSTQGGKAVYNLASNYLKKVVLELGGSDPFIVFPDASLEKTLDGAVLGRLLNCGQSCIGSKRFLVYQQIYKDFSEGLVERFNKIRVGDPSDPSTQMGPIYSEKGLVSLKAMLDDAVSKGARILCGGKFENGLLIGPTVIDRVNPSMKIFAEEVFGPVAVLYPVQDDDEAMALANGTSYGLGASLWGKDLVKLQSMAQKLECGPVFINSITKSDPRLPFGGVKKSGIGRELGRYGMLEFSNIKTINVYAG